VNSTHNQNNQAGFYRGKRTWYTAKEMALTSHNLSRDGMSATLANGEVWKWSEHFNVWGGPFPKTLGDAAAPRGRRSRAVTRKTHANACVVSVQS
jgi:hypothetical protein